MPCRIVHDCSWDALGKLHMMRVVMLGQSFDCFTPGRAGGPARRHQFVPPAGWPVRHRVQQRVDLPRAKRGRQGEAPHVREAAQCTRAGPGPPPSPLEGPAVQHSRTHQRRPGPELRPRRQPETGQSQQRAGDHGSGEARAPELPLVEQRLRLVLALLPLLPRVRNTAGPGAGGASTRSWKGSSLSTLAVGCTASAAGAL